MSEAPATLEVIGVSRHYRAGVAGCSADVSALDDVSFAVGPRECVGIAGAPGAGKTTLLLCAAGLLSPDTGLVRGVPGAFVASHGSAHPYLSVRASLDFAASVRELEGSGEPPDIDAVLSRTGLSELAGFRLGQLTAGMRARAGVAHALLAGPRLLCLDDPLAALDGAERRRYGAMLHELRADGIAVLLSAREPGLLEGIGARVIELLSGRIAAGSRRARTLELDVGMPRHAATALSGRIPSVRRRGRALRVPLERISAEEVLSTCRALGISVYGSRVIATGATGRVAEGGE